VQQFKAEAQANRGRLTPDLGLLSLTQLNTKNIKPVATTRQPQADHYYDNYDYATFWKGREYEAASDKLAVEYLLVRAFGPHRRIVDIGSGGGRMTPLYFSMFDESVLVDPSRGQLEVAREKFKNSPHVRVLQGAAENTPIPNQSADIVLCVRVFHYVLQPRKVFGEAKRILRPGGYLILEIPNKVHAKARMQNLLRGKDRRAHRAPATINISSNGDGIFLNHDPKAIVRDLAAEGFTVLETLSVSNLRSPSLKRLLPLRILVRLESMLQPVFSRLWFGPSIYFLAKLERKKISL